MQYLFVCEQQYDNIKLKNIYAMSRCCLKLGISAEAKPIIFNWVERLSNHIGDERSSTVGSSGESWSLNDSLNQHFAEMKNRNGYDGYDSCKVCA